jgi:hypothetical protein
MLNPTLPLFLGARRSRGATLPRPYRPLQDFTGDFYATVTAHRVIVGMAASLGFPALMLAAWWTVRWRRIDFVGLCPHTAKNTMT